MVFADERNDNIDLRLVSVGFELASYYRNYTALKASPSKTRTANKARSIVIQSRLRRTHLQLTVRRCFHQELAMARSFVIQSWLRRQSVKKMAMARSFVIQSRLRRTNFQVTVCQFFHQDENDIHGTFFRDPITATKSPTLTTVWLSKVERESVEPYRQRSRNHHWPSLAQRLF